MTAIRKAALFIYSLGPVDQEWLLSQLDPAQRALIATPLHELRQLGLPRDDAASLFSEITANESRSQVEVDEERKSGVDQNTFAFEGVDPGNIVRMLRNEHPAVAAAVLSRQETLLKQVVLARLPARHRRRAMVLDDSAKWSSRVLEVAANRAREAVEEIAKERAARGVFRRLRAVLS